MCHPRAITRRLRAVLGGWLIDVGAWVLPDLDPPPDYERMRRRVMAAVAARDRAARRSNGRSVR